MSTSTSRAPTPVSTALEAIGDGIIDCLLAVIMGFVVVVSLISGEILRRQEVRAERLQSAERREALRDGARV